MYASTQGVADHSRPSVGAPMDRNGALFPRVDVGIRLCEAPRLLQRLELAQHAQPRRLQRRQPLQRLVPRCHLELGGLLERRGLLELGVRPPERRGGQREGGQGRNNVNWCLAENQTYCPSE